MYMPEIKEITNLCMEESKNEEISQTICEELYKEYKKGNLSSGEVELIVIYDMGWNKRSSGNKYDSISRYEIVLGVNLKKIMNFRCTSNCCRICAQVERTKVFVEHKCPKKHDGSSKLMKSEAIYRINQSEAIYRINLSVKSVATFPSLFL